MQRPDNSVSTISSFSNANLIGIICVGQGNCFLSDSIFKQLLAVQGRVCSLILEVEFGQGEPTETDASAILDLACI